MVKYLNLGEFMISLKSLQLFLEYQLLSLPATANAINMIVSKIALTTIVKAAKSNYF